MLGTLCISPTARNKEMDSIDKMINCQTVKEIENHQSPMDSGEVLGQSINPRLDENVRC